MIRPVLATLACTALTSPALAQSLQPLTPYKPIAPLSSATSGDIAEMRRLLHGDVAALGTKLDAILAQLKAAPTSTAAAPATTTTDNFPAKPGDAPFPSPAGSRIVRVGSDVQGRPYLLDKRAAVHTLAAPTAGKSGYLINGTELTAYQGARVVLLIEGSDGEVYAQLDAGNIQHADPGMGNGLYNASLPDTAAATSTGGGTQTAATPATVTPSAIAPGSSGRVLTVGKDCTDLYACAMAAVDGDTVDGAGQLRVGSLHLISAAIKVRNFKLDCSTGGITSGKGCIVNDRDLIVEDAEIYGAAKNPNIDTGVGCIRPNGPSIVALTRVDIHDCPQGVAGGGFPWELTIQDSHLHENGLGDGATHNLYVTQLATKVTLIRVVSDKARGGHAIKSRGAAFSATDCTFSGDETLIDLPNGTSSVATVTNTTLTKTGGSGNHRLIGYGEEGASVGTAGMLVTGGTVTGLDNPFIQGTGTVTFKGTAIVGARPVGQGVTVVGP